MIVARRYVLSRTLSRVVEPRHKRASGASSRLNLERRRTSRDLYSGVQLLPNSSQACHACSCHNSEFETLTTSIAATVGSA